MYPTKAAAHKKHISEGLLITVQLWNKGELWCSNPPSKGAQKFRNLLGNDWNDKRKEKLFGRQKLVKRYWSKNGNIARIINHTWVTIINDIQHNGSNVERWHGGSWKERQLRKFVLYLNFDSSRKASFARYTKSAIKTIDRIVSSIFSHR